MREACAKIVPEELTEEHFPWGSFELVNK
jgi:hypothetical protein